MHSTTIFLPLLALSSSPLRALAQYDSPCPLLGPDFPPPSNPSISAAIQSAIHNVIASLKTALANATLDPNTTSFSLSVFSTHETASFFTFDYSAPAFAHPEQGVTTVDSNTIYATGSFSKLLTVYTYLSAVGDASFSDSITKYIPELAAYAKQNAAALQSNDIDYYDWESITVGALASQLSGIVRDFSLGPVQEAAVAQKIGLPPAPSTNVSYCGNAAQAQLPCNRSGWFQDILSEHPIAAPFHTPSYSNPPYAMLAYALENITGQDFPTLMADKLIKPLHLNATSYYAPATTTSSIIPFNATTSWYGANGYEEVPAGAYYTSINDMRLIGISILNSTLLSPALTRRWMKPHSFTSNPNTAVGAPWEILRAPINRTSWMYTKAGDVGLYSSEIALLPDYDAGFAVLAAGLQANPVVQAISDILAASFVPALEAAAKQQANAVYAGTYVDNNPTTSAPGGTNLTIATDHNPGLAITQWTENGTDVFQLLAAILPSTGSLQQSKVSVRLYPTGLKSRDGTKIAWRAVYEILPQTLDSGTFSENCQTWTSVDFLIYGAVGFDEFLFNLDASGAKKALSIEPRVLRNVLQKEMGEKKEKKEKKK